VKGASEKEPGPGVCTYRFQQTFFTRRERKEKGQVTGKVSSRRELTPSKSPPRKYTETFDILGKGRPGRGVALDVRDKKEKETLSQYFRKGSW